MLRYRPLVWLLTKVMVFWCSINLPLYINTRGPLTVQHIRTLTSWQEYIVQLHTTLPILYATTNVPIEPQIPPLLSLWGLILSSHRFLLPQKRRPTLLTPPPQLRLSHLPPLLAEDVLRQPLNALQRPHCRLPELGVPRLPPHRTRTHGVPHRRGPSGARGRVDARRDRSRRYGQLDGERGERC